MKNQLKLSLILAVLLCVSCETEETFDQDQIIEDEFDASSFLQWLESNKSSGDSASTTNITRKALEKRSSVQRKGEVRAAPPVPYVVKESTGVRKEPKGFVRVFKSQLDLRGYYRICDQRWKLWRAKLYKNCDNRWKKNKKERRKCRTWAGKHYGQKTRTQCRRP